MAILHSLPTMLLFGAAVILTAWGAGKRGHVLPFFGGPLGAAALYTARVIEDLRPWVEEGQG